MNTYPICVPSYKHRSPKFFELASKLDNTYVFYHACEQKSYAKLKNKYSNLNFVEMSAEPNYGCAMQFIHDYMMTIGSTTYTILHDDVCGFKHQGNSIDLANGLAILEECFNNSCYTILGANTSNAIGDGICQNTYPESCFIVDGACLDEYATDRNIFVDFDMCLKLTQQGKNIGIVANLEPTYLRVHKSSVQPETWVRILCTFFKHPGHYRFTVKPFKQKEQSGLKITPEYDLENTYELDQIAQDRLKYLTNCKSNLEVCEYLLNEYKARMSAN